MDQNEADQVLHYLEQALQTCQNRVTLTNVQLLLLQRCWAGSSYREIADELAYDPDYVKQLGAQLWQLLSQALGERVTKSNVRAVLIRAALQVNRVESALPVLPVRCDWGEATDASVFFGRTAELDTLHQWVEGLGEANSIPCRLVTLLGMGGIGKTTLAVKLAERLTGISRWGSAQPDSPPDSSSSFRHLCWKSLRDAPSLPELLAGLLKSLAPQSPQPESLSGQMALLLELLQTQRCLIVLDNFDALLEAGSVGSYQPGKQDYGELLRRLGEVPHKSCVIITSREKPEELLALAGDAYAVKVMQLPGLSETSGEQLVQAKGLSGSPATLRSLVNHYSGNPLALKIAASSIQDRYKGDLNRFLRQKDVLFKSISTLLQQQIERLSPLEIQVMNWLAINRESVSLEELQADLSPSVDRELLAKALDSLEGRCLIEQTADGFTQQPVVMEHITRSLIEQFLAELLSRSSNSTQTSASMLERYALIKATAKDYIRESQARMIVEPLLAQLRTQLKQQLKQAKQPEQIALIQFFNQWFDQYRMQQRQPLAQPGLGQGYGMGNLLNLRRHLQLDFADLDLSHCRIWQAYLADVNLHYASFQAAELRQCVFAETFGGIVAVAVSPAGDRLASADSNGDLRVWDLERNQPILALKAHRVWIWSIAFSPDGSRLATASDDNAVKIWSVETGVCLHELEDHKHSVLAAVFSPDGTRLATSSDDLTIRLWRFKEDALTCEQVWQNTHEQRVWALSFSPDGQTLASSSEDRTVKFWRVTDGTCLQTLAGHTNWVRGIAFHPSQPLFASGSHDQTIHIWRRNRGTDRGSDDTDLYSCQQTLRGHSGPVTAVAFSPQGQHLISASHDQTLRLWDLETGQCLSVLQGHSNRLWAALFHPGGKWVASGGDDNAVKLWDWQRGCCIKTFQGHTNATLPIALHPERQVLASGHEDETVRLWDRQTGQVLQTLRGHSDRVWCVAFGPRQAGKNLLASGSGDQTIRLWNWRTGTCLRTLTGHESWVWSVLFHPTRPILASSSYDATVRLWDVSRGTCLNVLQGHEASVVGLLFSPDGDWLASCGYDHTIRFWDLQGNPLRTLRGHQNTVWQMALSPDGRLLASCGYDQTVKLWDLESGDCLQTLEGHAAPLVTLAFSTDGQQLFSAGFDATIRRWQVETGTCLQVIQGHQGVISKLIVDDLLFSSSFDETIKLWDLASGTCLHSWRTPRPYEGLDITQTTGLTEAQRTTLIALGAVETIAAAGPPRSPQTAPSPVRRSS